MLIFFDIDGTLIDEETKEIYDSASVAIQQARANGHICIINTGRSQKLVEADAEKLQGFDGFSYGCGTRIVLHDEVLLQKTFTVEEANRIIAALNKYKIDAVLEGTVDNFRAHYDAIFTDKFRTFMKEFEDLHYRYFEEAPGNFDKFFCYAPAPGSIQGFMEEMSDLLEMVDRKKGFYEIMPKGHSKASAIRFLAEKLGIPMSQTVAIGDSSNDIPMLKGAGIGIAMGNATEDVKAVSTYVTSHIQENGIRDALKWLGAIEG